MSSCHARMLSRYPPRRYSRAVPRHALVGLRMRPLLPCASVTLPSAAADREDFDTAKCLKEKLVPLRIQRAEEVAKAQAAARVAADETARIEAAEAASSVLASARLGGSQRSEDDRLTVEEEELTSAGPKHLDERSPLTPKLVKPNYTPRETRARLTPMPPEHPLDRARRARVRRPTR